MARVLVIDDDAVVRDVFVRILRQAGHEVIEASEGRQGLKVAEQAPVDLVVTDINMPGMDGMEVITALRRTQAGVPVIAISGGGVFPKQMLLTTASALGAIDVLSKPFRLRELVTVVDRALCGSAV